MLPAGTAAPANADTAGKKGEVCGVPDLWARPACGFQEWTEVFRTGGKARYIKQGRKRRGTLDGECFQEDHQVVTIVETKGHMS
jgi:hypothetical protein